MLALLVSTLAHAQSGSFVIPSIRASSGTDFACWDLFARPPGSPTNVNYNYANPPALLNGLGEDDDSNPTTAFATRTTLVQNGTPNCFITSSGAIYSFSDTTAFEVPYTPPSNTTAAVTNVIFQTQSGGSRLNVSSVKLRYTSGAQTIDVSPVFKALDDPQTGSFGERIICAFQWNLTGLGVRNFKIIFAAPSASMPLWQAQLDVVVGGTFVQQLGYLLTTRARPLTRFGRPGTVNKNLPPTVDGRFFLEGENLSLTADSDTSWLHTGWHYNGVPSTAASLPISFPANDITVTALFAPEDYESWREAMFDHANEILGTEDDYTDDTVSAKPIDHDQDGLNNAGEYAFGSDPYQSDATRWSPQMARVDVSGVAHPAIRYRTNGAPASNGDTAFVVQLSTDNSATWQDNGTTPTTVGVSRVLQADGSELVTERTVQPLSALPVMALRVGWSAAGINGTPLMPAPLSITSAAMLAGGRVGTAYAATLAGTGGTAPYTWSVSAGTLPTGLSVSTAGLLSGIPASAATFDFTVQLTDANSISVAKVMQVTIQPFVISTITLPSGQLNMAYTSSFAATGGTTPLTWSISSGLLPTGLSLSTDGVLSGTPTVAGAFAFTVQVTDANTFTASKSFTLAVLNITTPTPLPGAVQGVAYNIALAATGGTQPYAWSVSSGTLPAGLALSSAGALTGTPTSAGLSNFTVQLTDDDGFSITKPFALTVFAAFQVPVVNPISFGSTTIGAAWTYTVSATNYPKSFAIVGLPSGLTFNATTGVITGKPSVTGVFNVQVTAKNTGGTSATVTAPLVVKALPTNMTGTFSGLVARNAINTNLGSKLSLTVAANGFYTAKITTGTTIKSATGYLAASAPQVVVPVDGKPLSLTLANNELTGTYNGIAVTGYRQVWNSALNPSEDLAGYYSIALELATPGDVGVVSIPQGYGFATFTVTNAGTFTLVGKTADGQAVTNPGFVGPAGELCVYAPQYVNKGSLWGELTLTADAGGLFVDNTASGTLDWFKAATTVPARTYLSTFTVSLNAYGKYLAPKATGSVVLGLPSAGNLDLDFSDAGLSLAAQNPDVTFSYSSANAVTVPTNTTKTSLTINKANGVVSGKFTLTETTPPLVRKDIAFAGQTVRFATGDVKAVGHFLLPQIPTVGQTAATAPILSGSLTVEE